jgi:phage antirepressor YoqD-like protein
LPIVINETDDKMGDDKKTTIKTDDKKVTIKRSEQKAMIVDFLRNNHSAKSADLCALLGVKSTRLKELLYELVNDGVIVADGANRNRTYSLK